MAHLILAEAALAGNASYDFATEINAVRSLDEHDGRSAVRSRTRTCSFTSVGSTCSCRELPFARPLPVRHSVEQLAAQLRGRDHAGNHVPHHAHRDPLEPEHQLDRSRVSSWPV